VQCSAVQSVVCDSSSLFVERTFSLSSVQYGTVRYNVGYKKGERVRAVRFTIKFDLVKLFTSGYLSVEDCSRIK
jgi:hypothetical protein